MQPNQLILSLSMCLWMSLPVIGQEASKLDARPRTLQELVIIYEGELPIVISAPHGGSHAIDQVEKPREGKGMEKGGKGYFIGRDTGTQELAEAVIGAIEKRFGKKPYGVISSAHRKYLDPNRPRDIAYEDADAKPVYDRYHQTLERFTKKIMNECRFGLLLDIHGQVFKSNTVFRGTKDGKTVERLRGTFGLESHTGAKSLFGILKTQGWTVHPDPHDEKEQSGYTGGYIVQTYGSHNPIGIDAVQLEFGSDYRTAGNRQMIAEQLADGVMEYATLYLPTVESKR